ncbi:MAG TPA: polyprenyl synthetase family protein [Acidimicrobiales bacterium]|nr:polyprenyl synthetase family protein [Acidimicrobiales bacterium]
MTAIETVPESLDRARRLVVPNLRWAVDRLGTQVRTAVEYQLGWVDAQGRPTAAGAGKGIRPALAVLSSEAAGGTDVDAVAGAVAVELIHNFSLVHDDVIDGDEERRHRPTVWAAFGIGPAVIAGDALFALALEVLIGAGPNGPAAALCLTEATSEMIAGQADDMAFESRGQVSLEECMAMAGRKTGALLACASSIGALLSGGEGGSVDALARYGTHLGLSFQAVDDLLGIWGDPSRTGKPAHSDLRSRKKSMPVVAALTSNTTAGYDLAELLGRSALDDDDISLAARLVEQAGGKDATVALASEHLDAALAALQHPELAAEPVEELQILARFVTARDF